MNRLSEASQTQAAPSSGSTCSLASGFDSEEGLLRFPSEIDDDSRLTSRFPSDDSLNSRVLPRRPSSIDGEEGGSFVMVERRGL